MESGDAGGPTAAKPITAEDLAIVGANHASWADLRAIFGTRDYCGRCYCQRFKTRGGFWDQATDEQRRASLRVQANVSDPADTALTTGLVAYLTGSGGAREPVGWVAVEPRTEYPRLLGLPTVWKGRPGEDQGDDSVWAVTCFVVRRGYRNRGITYALAAAAVGYAKENGARAIEGYAMITQPGREVTWGELHVGARQVFADAGFAEVSRPSVRRAVMRVDFDADADDADQTAEAQAAGGSIRLYPKGRGAAASPSGSTGAGGKSPGGPLLDRA